MLQLSGQYSFIFRRSWVSFSSQRPVLTEVLFSFLHSFQFIINSHSILCCITYAVEKMSLNVPKISQSLNLTNSHACWVLYSMLLLLYNSQLGVLNSCTSPTKYYLFFIYSFEYSNLFLLCVPLQCSNLLLPEL